MTLVSPQTGLLNSDLSRNYRSGRITVKAMPCAFFPFVRGHIKPGYKNPHNIQQDAVFRNSYRDWLQKNRSFLASLLSLHVFFPEQAARNQMKE
jgi:hypothetical protein